MAEEKEIEELKKVEENLKEVKEILNKAKSYTEDRIRNALEMNDSNKVTILQYIERKLDLAEDVLNDITKNYEYIKTMTYLKEARDKLMSARFWVTDTLGALNRDETEIITYEMEEMIKKMEEMEEMIKGFITGEREPPIIRFKIKRFLGNVKEGLKDKDNIKLMIYTIFVILIFAGMMYLAIIYN